MSVTNDDYRRARHIGDAVAPLLSDALRSSKRGRQSMDSRIFCCGLILSIDVHNSGTVTDIHSVLTRDLPRTNNGTSESCAGIQMVISHS